MLALNKWEESHTCDYFKHLEVSLAPYKIVMQLNAIGTTFQVECMCGDSVELTDYECW